MNDRLVSLIPLENIEPSAMQQVYTVLQNECVKKLAIMPDVHTGYSLPIGAVALLDGHVSPAYVGYDISCGMAHFNTGIKMNLDDEYKREVFNKIYEKVPCGEGKSNTKETLYPNFISGSGSKELEKEVNAKVPFQLGTLGGGNHFIELGYTENTHELCVTIHSGSRNIGHRICTWYCKNAPALIPVDSDLGKAYLDDMTYCINWARINRLEIMRRIIRECLTMNISADTIINNTITVTHNFAEITPDGILHRKGATPAKLGEIGVIPGNMRDGVWIVKGLGNAEFLNSSSHGCGRTMSRSKAKETYTMDEFKYSMMGIVANVSQNTLDESPMAYKDAEMVINAQEGRVFNVITKVLPIINVKG